MYIAVSYLQSKLNVLYYQYNHPQYQTKQWKNTADILDLILTISSHASFFTEQSKTALIE